jgi:hypothetical protein
MISTTPVNKITLDASNKTISKTTETTSAKKLDAANRQLAESPAVSPSVPSVDVPKQEEGSQPTDSSETRKLFLQAQKTKRIADADAKKASSGLAKATAIEKAIALTASGEDPTALLTAAGLDPIKFYQDLTTHILKAPPKAVDPVQQKLQEHEERLAKYANDLEVRDATIKEREQTAAINQAITQAVIPLLQNNVDKYETMIAEYGSNAAIQIYKACEEEYIKTGTAYSFEQMADAMEEYWSKKVEDSINKVYQMKKFQNRFSAPTRTSNDIKTERYDNNTSSKTLTNKSISSSSNSHGDPYSGLTKEERVAAILKKFNGR